MKYQESKLLIQFATTMAALNDDPINQAVQEGIKITKSLIDTSR